MKKILLTFLFLVFCVSAAANPVNFREARTIAQNWTIILRTNFHENVTLEAGTGREIIKENKTVAYVFSYKPTGFVIIAAEDYLPPVKFYTTTFDFDQHDRAVKFQDTLFRNLEKIIKEVDRRKLDIDRSFGVENREFFQFLRGYHKFLQTRPTAQTQEVGPLLRTRWTQTGVENLKCPVIEGYRAPTGCVATAIAQIMKYHEFPGRGRGNHSYTLHNYNIPLSADFDHEYDWNNMLDYYAHENVGTEPEREAISTLMYDVGVALEMVYTPHYSTVNPMLAVDALPKYFKYSNEIGYIYRFGYTDTEWCGLAKDQIDQGLPVAFTLSGSPDGGHECVIDGYRIVNQSRTFHINFGWHGLDDGYYSLNEVLDFAYLPAQGFILNMKPPHYRYIKAPGNISAVCYKNQSLLQTEYHAHITWDETPTGDNNIDKYIVYRKLRKDNENKKERVAEIVPAGEKIWTFITPSFDTWEYEYTVIAVDSLGNRSKNPEWVRVEPSY